MAQFWGKWAGLAVLVAGSSKKAPWIFIFSIVLGAEDLSLVKFIAVWAPTFFGYIISVLGSVSPSPTQKIVDLENSKLYPTLLYYSLKLLFVAYFTGEMNAKVVRIKVFYNGT